MLLSKFYTAARTTLREVQLAPSWASRRPIPGVPTPGLSPAARGPALQQPARNISGLVPINQYENNILPKKFQFGYALFHHWEIIPLFLVVVFDIFIVLGISLYMAVQHKVDTQFQYHNWNCISRNMDLRNPTIHKLLVFYQPYEPWPEMQGVLDKMSRAEHRAHARLKSCNVP